MKRLFFIYFEKWQRCKVTKAQSFLCDCFTLSLCHFASLLLSIFVSLLYDFGNGAPTATSHRCPGCPCGGFIPSATV